MIGQYISSDTVMLDEVRKEWHDWLNSPAGMDPGNYDAYKDKTNGQWKCDVFCPNYILAKIPSLKEG